jgi:hypothetical protein
MTHNLPVRIPPVQTITNRHGCASTTNLSGRGGFVFIGGVVATEGPK